MDWWQDVYAIHSNLKWYRSWPAQVPERRAYVQDSLPRLLMSDCDYSTVQGGLPGDEPGFCMLEWDIALSIDERAVFAERAEANPDKILVAPYTKNYGGGGCLQIHRRMGYISIDHGAPTADFFAFGCIYMPQKLLREWTTFRAEQRKHFVLGFNDTTFSNWHWQHYGPADVFWDVHPQHLHGD
jgi:hypothetical protein